MKTQTSAKPKTTATRTRKTAAKSTAVSAEARQQMIAEAAYYRAANRGFSGGDTVEDWLVAETEIDRQITN